MDIYSAEIQVQKLLNYVKSVSESTKSKTLYQKSKVRLRDLADNCSQIVSIISEILQEEAMSDVTPEFGGVGTTDLYASIRDMEMKIQELRNFVNLPPGLNSGLVHPPDVSVDYASASKDSVASLVKYVPDASESRRQAMRDYGNVLQTLSTTSMIVIEAEDCCDMMWRWFSARFMNTPEDFRYNMGHIPRWMRDIVVMYGYHVSRGTVDEFKHKFNTWLSLIPTGNKYVVPIDVYKMDTKADASKMTLTALVLWDVLWDSGLNRLGADIQSDMYPSEDCVFEFIGLHNSDVMKNYQHYSQDREILRACNLTLKVGDIEC